MNNQLQKVLAEIERRVNKYADDTDPVPMALKSVIDFLNSLPTEPSEDLKEKINNFFQGWSENNGIACYFQYVQLQDCKRIARHFAHWQKEQMMKGFCYETKVYRDEEGDGIDTPIESWLALENNEITNLPNIGLKDGDKVKVIIVKEDKQ